MRRNVLKRCRQRGAVAVEFALSLFFLIPLLLGTLDYGHYYWIGIHVVEAARAGARAGAVAAGSPLAACPVAASAADVAAHTATTNAVNAEMLKTSLTATYRDTTHLIVTQSCVMTGTVGGWSVQVTSHFPPAVGFMSSFMPPSTVASTLTHFSSPTIVSP